MKFKSQHRSSQMPELNLVPMIDLIMTVLTFFIVVSMTLTNGAGSVKVQLPTGQGNPSSPNEKLPARQIIKIDAQGGLYMVNEANPQAEAPSTLEQLEPQVANYLQQNPQGLVLISADRQLSYDKVIQVLIRLKTVGGDRVSLAFQQG
jgi:biopolymer transport protein ExbD